MSRSRRKKPIAGVTTSPSDKTFKVEEHQRERQKVRQVLRTGQDDVDVPSPRKYGDPWKAPKDGKQYGCDRRRLRK